MEYLLSNPVCDKLLHDIVGEVGQAIIVGAAKKVLEMEEYQ